MNVPSDREFAFGSRDPLRVLVVVEGGLAERRAGPEIRGWEMARVLAARHDVTVAARVDRARRLDGVRVVPSRRRSLARAALSSDVVVAPWIPPFLYALLLARPARAVADLYDPADVELRVARAAGAEEEAVRRLTGFQVRFADALICAGEPQRARIEGLLSAIPARSGRPRVEVVPLGLHPPPPPARGRPLRERFGFAAGDVVVLWWGTPWAWLDVETAILAVERIAPVRPDVKLVISAAAAPDPEAAPLAATGRARALAAERSLAGRSVFFLDEWVPYEQRHEYLRDADIGLTLHPEGAEALLAARARYMDYLWAGLPCVLSRGDVLAERFAAGGLATLVEPGDAGAVAEAIAALAGDEARRSEAGRAAALLARSHGWEDAVAPLGALLEDAGFHAGRPRRRRDAAGVVAAAAGYYARRLRWRRPGGRGG